MRPMRKIGKSKSSLRALAMSDKIGRQVELESSLERDFCCLLEFNPDVESYIEQPITLEYEFNGCIKHYTPDFYVRYFNGTECLPELIEVKYRNDIKKNWDILKPKFKAAKYYSQQRAIRFKIITEVEIRGSHYLNNIKFLLQFKNNSRLPDQSHTHILMKTIESIKITTPEEILLLVFRDDDRKAELIPTLWNLIATGLIGCDLFSKLTMRSEIWCVTD